MNSQNDAKQVVMSFVNAINKEDFKKARQYVSDEISFVGAMGSRQGADVYFKDMERMRLKYNIKKVFADANDVCLFYDLTISGITVFGCAWYQVADGKIRSLKVVFDPRPHSRSPIETRKIGLIVESNIRPRRRLSAHLANCRQCGSYDFPGANFRDSDTILEKALLGCTDKQRSNVPTVRLTQCRVLSHMCAPRWQPVVLRFNGHKVYSVYQNKVRQDSFEWPPSLHVR